MLKKFIILTLYLNLLFAHPHTFIEVYPTIEVQNNKIIKLHFTWELDDMSSAMLIMEFDQNGDGKIDKKENKFIRKNYFEPLIDYNFYTDVNIKNKIQSTIKPINFKADIKNNKARYSFDVKSNYPIKDLHFDFGDEDFFVAMVLKKEFIKIKGAKAKVSDLDNDYYFGYRLEIK